MFPTEGEFVCRNCDNRIPVNGHSQTISEAGEDKELLVVEDQMDTLPKTKIECPECGHNEAYWVMRQTRAADEPETLIYRCVSCSNTWRQY